MNLVLGIIGVTLISFVVGFKLDLTPLWLKGEVRDPMLILWLLSWVGGLALMAILEWIFSCTFLLTGATYGGITSFFAVALGRTLATSRRKKDVK